MYLVVVQGGVKGRGEAGRTLEFRDDGLVTGLDGQDGTGGGEVVGLLDVVGGTEVGGNTDTFENTGDGDKGLDIVVTERVGAFLAVPSVLDACKSVKSFTLTGLTWLAFRTAVRVST